MHSDSSVIVVMARVPSMDDSRPNLEHRSCLDGPFPALGPSRARNSVICRVPSEASTSSGYSSSVPGNSSKSQQSPSRDDARTANVAVEGTSASDPSRSRKRGVGSRLELPLREKIQVINARDSGKTMRQIATEFGCGKTQILNILSRRDRYQREWEVVCKVGFLGGGADRKRAARRTGNEETNRRVYQWWKEAEANGVRVTGPLLQSTARNFARNLGFDTFAASNGWLASFRKTYGVQLKHDLAMERETGFSNTRTKPLPEQRVPKIEVNHATAPHGSNDVNDSIDTKSLVEILIEDELESSTSPSFKPEFLSSKSPSLSSNYDEIPSLLNFVMRQAQGNRLVSFAYPDEEENWWLEIRRRHASYVVPHFGYRSHLYRLLVSQDLGFWLEVLGDCISWGSLCNQQGELDISKLNSILSSVQSDTVCSGAGEVHVKSRDPQQVRFASSAGLSVGAFVSRPDFRYRSFNCSKLLPKLQNEVTCRSCLNLPLESASGKGQPIRNRDCSDAHANQPMNLPRITVDDSETGEHIHPKKRMRISYSGGQGSGVVSPLSPSQLLELPFEILGSDRGKPAGTLPIDYSPTRSPTR